MQLITGGLGFIGLHTARACLDAGEDVVLTQYRVAREPDFIKSELGKRAFVEQLDVTDKDRLREIGNKYKITGITHLAVPALNALSPADEMRGGQSPDQFGQPQVRPGRSPQDCRGCRIDRAQGRHGNHARSTATLRKAIISDQIDRYHLC